MDPYQNYLNRAQMLMSQHRMDMAEETLQQAIGVDPDRGTAYSWLAMIKSGQKSYPEATELAQRGVALQPDDAVAYYILASVFQDRGKYDEAGSAIDTAIQLDPTDPDFYGLLGGIAAARYQWQDAIDACETGLQFDPDHATCNNLRAIALTKLGRREEAGVAMDSVLADNPEDPIAHANVGWTKLHAGLPDEAANHFKEALRLDPNNSWAREGIIESLKAKNFFYRQFLRYILWVSRFPPKTQLFAFIGIILVLQVMNRLPEDSWLGTVGLVLSVCYLMFVSTLWLASPLFDLLLRMSKLGRLVLTDEKRWDTNYLLIALTGIGVLMSGPIFTGFRTQDLISYLVVLIAVAVMLSTSRQAKRGQATIAVIAIFCIAFVYWYRWYIDSGLPGLPRISDVDALRAWTETVDPDEIDERLPRLNALVRTQGLLSNLFVFPSVAMSWLSGYFAKQDR